MSEVRGTILVVDDEPDVRTLCRVNLEYEKYRVLEAAGGEEALRVAREERPQLILLDLMMPDVDGWQVLERLKEDDLTASIPVVILTAKADEESQLRGWEGGVLDYLTKPFTPMALSPVVERALAGRDPEEEERRRGVIMKRLQLLREMRQAEEGRHGT